MTLLRSNLTRAGRVSLSERLTKWAWRAHLTAEEAHQADALTDQMIELNALKVVAVQQAAAPFDAECTRLSKLRNRIVGRGTNRARRRGHRSDKTATIAKARRLADPAHKEPRNA